jgi:hypothetical protein
MPTTLRKFSPLQQRKALMYEALPSAWASMRRPLVQSRWRILRETQMRQRKVVQIVVDCCRDQTIIDLTPHTLVVELRELTMVFGDFCFARESCSSSKLLGLCQRLDIKINAFFLQYNLQ